MCCSRQTTHPMRRLCGRFWNRLDYRVLVAGDGLQALEIAHAERPDLLILGVTLPSLNGFELCSRLRSDPDCARSRSSCSPRSTSPLIESGPSRSA